VFKIEKQNTQRPGKGNRRNCTEIHEKRIINCSFWQGAGMVSKATGVSLWTKKLQRNVIKLKQASLNLIKIF
jgi:hypothetical protein